MTTFDFDSAWAGDDAEPDGRADEERREALLARLRTFRDFASLEPDSADELLGPIVRRGWRTLIGGHTGEGKALALDTPIPTPDGWKTMLDIRAGDMVYGSDGRPVAVTHATGVMLGNECFRVRFSDGSEIVADADHLWLAHSQGARNRLAALARRKRNPRPPSPFARDQSHVAKTPEVVSTRELAARLARGERSYSIPCAGPVERYPADLPIDPYVFGVWLGDGHSAAARVTAHIDDLPHFVQEFEAAGERIGKAHADSRSPNVATFGFGLSLRRNVGKEGTAQARLRHLGVLGNKHIPESYLNGSISQRLALLQGIVDSDGSVNQRGLVDIGLSNERLARDVHALALSLGLRAVISTRPTAKKDSWRIKWTGLLPVARLPRKAERLRTAPIGAGTRASHRYIVAVEPIPSVPVKCIAVDAPDHLYLAGRNYIPTHNTTLALDMIRAIVTGGPFLGWRGPKEGAKALVIDVEQDISIAQRRIGETWLRGQYDPGLPLSSMIGDDPSLDRAWYWQIPEGLWIDESEVDRRVVEEVVEEVRPDVVMLDPLYKTFMGDPNEQVLAQKVMRFFDVLRATHGFGLVLPMHPRKPHNGSQFTKHDLYGSGSWIWGAEIILGVQRLPESQAWLHFWKDRAGELGVDDKWKLAYHPESGYERVDTGGASGKLGIKDRAWIVLQEAPGEWYDRETLEKLLGTSGRHLRRALSEMEDEWKAGDGWEGLDVTIGTNRAKNYRYLKPKTTLQEMMERLRAEGLDPSEEL